MNAYAEERWSEGWDAWLEPAPDKPKEHESWRWWHRKAKAMVRREPGGSEGRAGLEAVEACLSMLLMQDQDGESIRWRPLWDIGGKRSALPEDLSVADRNRIRSAAEKARTPWMRARLWDVLWTIEQRRDDACEAVDAYLEIGWRGSSGRPDYATGWRRAWRIVCRIGDRERKKRLRTGTLRAMKEACKAPAEYDVEKMAGLLEQAGVTGKEVLLVREALEARMAEDLGRWGWEGTRNAAFGWAEKPEDKVRLWKDGARRMERDAREFTPIWKAEKIREVLREARELSIPKEVGEATGMQAEMDRYEAEIQRLRKEPDPTMKLIESADFNVAAAAASTRERMQDVDGRSAMGELPECAEPVSREWCERTGEAGRGVLADLARTVHLDEMGRPREDTRADGIRIDPETAWAARRWIEVQAVGNILPAVEIVQERLGSEAVETLERWVERCPAIAEDHRRIAVRALQAGYEKDLMGFVAFGVPTMEHLLANLMEQEGVVTAPTTRGEEPASMQWALEREEVRATLGTGGPNPRSSARPDPGSAILGASDVAPGERRRQGERKRHVEDAR